MKKMMIAAAAMIAATAFATGANAQSQILLKLGDVKGDVNLAGFEDQIDLLSMNYGLGTGDIRRVTCSAVPLKIVKYIDIATADIILGAAKGTAYKEAVITFVRLIPNSKAERSLELRLQDVYITYYDSGGSVGQDMFTENVTFKYGAISGTVFSRDSKGVEVKEPFDVKCI